MVIPLDRITQSRDVEKYKSYYGLTVHVRQIESVAWDERD